MIIPTISRLSKLNMRHWRFIFFAAESVFSLPLQMCFAVVVFDFQLDLKHQVNRQSLLVCH